MTVLSGKLTKKQIKNIISLVEINRGQSFSALFKKYRLKAGFTSLKEFGDYLAKEGFIYEDSIFSHWQNGNRIPKERKLLLKLAEIFIAKSAIAKKDQINELLSSINQGYLTYTEERNISDLIRKYSIEESKNDNVNIFESTIINNNIYDVIEEKTRLIHEKIYEGYPHEAYQSSKSLINFLIKSKFRLTKRGQRLITRLSWVRLRCLSDITEIDRFNKVYCQAVDVFNYLKETTNSACFGPVIWMVAALKRLEIVTKYKQKKATEKETRFCLQIAEDAIKKTPNNYFSERLVEHLELAKIFLILKEKNNYEKQINMAFLASEKIPKEEKYLQTLIWDTLTRGDLTFGNNLYRSLNNIHYTRQHLDPRYQAINLFLTNTEYQVLITIKDEKYLNEAENLRKRLMTETNLLNNPYQKARFHRKKYIGL